MDASKVLALSRRPCFRSRFVIVGADVARCQQADFASITALAGLRDLTVRAPGSSVASIASVSGAGALRSLRLMQRVGESVRDLAPIGHLRALTTFTLHSCQLPLGSGLGELRVACAGRRTAARGVPRALD